MSGIAGILRFDGNMIDRNLIEAMTATMSYRGPDGISHWHGKSAALSHCMLHTTPESLEEKQPLESEDGRYVLVMDGRIDNWDTLRRELIAKDIVLRTRSDAELVLAAYQKWGHDSLSRIDGDFAFAIWDTQARSLFCARDRFGNKPFHYHWDGKTFAFASDVRPLLDLPWVPRVLNEGMVAEFLAAEWHSHDETLWQSLLRLPPAHRLSTTTSGLKLNRYWEPDLFAALPCKSDDDYVEYYRELLFDIVRRLTRSHRPIACEVSGGLDSSAIFAVADRLEKRQLLLAPSIQGYTLDFSGDPYADEVKYARAVGAYLGRTIHEVKPASPSLDWYTERTERFLDFPDYPHGAMGQSILDRAETMDCRVLFSGAGGDEWLKGSHAYYGEMWQNRHRAPLLDFFRSEANGLGLRRTLWNIFRHGIAPLAQPSLKRAIRSLVARKQRREPRIEWLAPDLARLLETRTDTRRSNVSVARAGQFGLLRHLSDAYSPHARQLNERRASLSGIEWRQPFMSKRLVEFAFASPEHLRARAGDNRWVHRQAMRSTVPELVRTRKTKAEFTVAFECYWHELGVTVERFPRLHGDRWIVSHRAQAMHAGGPRSTSGNWPTGSIWSIFALDPLLKDDKCALSR
jgi:asparagine synthase (glutamine-hydrolysing)